MTPSALLFFNTKVHYIPRKLTKIFPNLAHLAISKCELKEVSAEDLVGLSKLESLILPNNNITNLPEDLFKNTENLKTVILSANLLQNFDAKILQPIRNTIGIVNVMGNPGVHRYFHDKSGIEDFIERMERLESKKTATPRSFHERQILGFHDYSAGQGVQSAQEHSRFAEPRFRLEVR